jgi:hypothetical protein
VTGEHRRDEGHEQRRGTKRSACTQRRPSGKRRLSAPKMSDDVSASGFLILAAPSTELTRGLGLRYRLEGKGRLNV